MYVMSFLKQFGKGKIQKKYPQEVKFWQYCLFSKSVSVNTSPSGLDVWQEMVVVTVKVKNISRRCWWREVGSDPWYLVLTINDNSNGPDFMLGASLKLLILYRPAFKCYFRNFCLKNQKSQTREQKRKAIILSLNFIVKLRYSLWVPWNVILPWCDGMMAFSYNSIFPSLKENLV